MRERERKSDQLRATKAIRPSEWIAGALAALLLASCLALTLGACGGDDLVVGGNVPPPTVVAATPSPTP
jgi:hypothetical protein